MPYASKKQARFMHARHPEIAEEWDEKTDFSKLPEKKKKKKTKKSLSSILRDGKYQNALDELWRD